jgi:CHAT domain-containing protein/SIR2-like protein
MSKYADLEIVFRKRDERSYVLNFRYSSPDDEVDHPALIEPVITLDSAAFRGDDARAYSDALTVAFFTPEVRAEFGRFRDITQQKSSILRVRLSIDSSAPELHAIRWETLRDPYLPADQTDAYLFMGEQTIVSRFLTSGDWRPVRLQPKAELRALVVIANPSTSSGYGLEPIDVAGELARIKQAMASVTITTLAPGGAVSLNDVAARLREGFDILYLVCHGKLVDQQPYLYMDEGRPDQGLDLVQKIRELDHRPRMVVLASCQSAGKGGVGLAGLGPRLAEAGVPAVIAMQGNIFMTTAAAFMKRFFTELLVDGQIDRAMSVARGEVRNADDFWMPVLFLRLRNGRIWYEPGFAGDSKEQFDHWESICIKVREGRFSPLLGPELGEELFGGTQEQAARLADKYKFPLASHERSNLAKVSQYISVDRGREHACEALALEFVKRLGGVSPSELPGLLQGTVDACRANPDAAYTLLSAKEFPVSIYLNACYETMLLRVLKSEGRTPEPVYGPWRGAEVAQKPQPKTTIPTPDNPWVYHIFGVFGKPDTMVLTEDDFFDYLIASSRLNLLLPALISKLMESSLVFLGFRLDDWRFRVLYRLIVTQQGAAALSGRCHVGVQVNPGEQSVADVNRAIRYMTKYFQGGNSSNAPSISIYWGSPADFLKQLQHQLTATAGTIGTKTIEKDPDDWP